MCLKQSCPLLSSSNRAISAIRNENENRNENGNENVNENGNKNESLIAAHRAITLPLLKIDRNPKTVITISLSFAMVFEF